MGVLWTRGEGNVDYWINNVWIDKQIRSLFDKRKMCVQHTQRGILFSVCVGEFDLIFARHSIALRDRESSEVICILNIWMIFVAGRWHFRKSHNQFGGSVGNSWPLCFEKFSCIHERKRLQRMQVQSIFLGTTSFTVHARLRHHLLQTSF